MPVKKIRRSKKVLPKKVQATLSDSAGAVLPVTESLVAPVSKWPPKFFSWRYLLLAVIVVGAVLFFWKNKSLLVVATVNGRPIPRWDLEQRLNAQYGKQTLDEMVNEQLIIQAGQKKGIQITDKEISGKVTEVEKSLNGSVSLEEALAGQGLTLEEFRQQIKLQLILEKLAGTSMGVTDQEINDYIQQNRPTMTATDDAGLKSEARQALTTQKQSTILRQLFTDLKNQAKIVKYL